MISSPLFSCLSAAGVLALGLTGVSAVAQAHSFVAASGPGATNATSSRPVGTSTPAAAPVRPFSADVRDGILTVDGLVGKAGMNYTIHQGFLYFTVPGVGTAVVAQTRFMNAAPQKNAFHGNVLTIDVNGHTVELTSASPLVPLKVTEAWVSIDPLYGANKRFPSMGFGETTQRPYQWPGSKAEPAKAEANALVTAPPLPESVRPKMELTSSYAVSVPPTETPKK
jgi:hypothetical protein